MPLNKVIAGSQMYQDWITHTWPVGRGCHHQCSYCYVHAIGGQPVGFIPQPKPDLGHGKTIFVGNCIDLFAADMSQQEIDAVLRHCQKYPANKYVFQTKNPWRMFENLHSIPQAVPGQSTLGTTIETDDAELLAKHSKAPPPMERAEWIRSCGDAGFKTFLTIEPVMKFDLEELLELIKTARPNFINIGADSKGHNLPEPTHDETLALVQAIKCFGIKLILKPNLGRILKNQ
jgi:DNA repair photolyase